MKRLARILALLLWTALPFVASAGALDKPTVPGATPTPGGSSGLKTSPLDNTAAGTDRIVGRWKFGGDIWVISANGKCHRSHPNFGEGGAWKALNAGSPAKYEINWSGGRAIDTVYYSAGQDKILSKDKNGKYHPIGERAVTN
jgi:hypothetical protein